MVARLRIVLSCVFALCSCHSGGLRVPTAHDAGLGTNANGGQAGDVGLTASDTSASGGITSDASANGGTTSDTSASGGTTSDASGRVNVTFNYSPPSFIGVNCTEHAPRDPVDVGLNVLFSPPEGESPDSVTFPAARIKFTNTSNALTWTFEVMTEPFPTSPTLVAKSLWKVADSGSGQGSGVPCDYCDTMAEFDLQVVSPAQTPYWATGLSPVQCQR